MFDFFHWIYSLIHVCNIFWARPFPATPPNFMSLVSYTNTHAKLCTGHMYTLQWSLKVMAEPRNPYNCIWSLIHMQELTITHIYREADVYKPTGCAGKVQHGSPCRAHNPGSWSLTKSLVGVFTSVFLVFMIKFPGHSLLHWRWP